MPVVLVAVFDVPVPVVALLVVVYALMCVRIVVVLVLAARGRGVLGRFDVRHEFRTAKLGCHVRAGQKHGQQTQDRSDSSQSIPHGVSPRFLEKPPFPSGPMKCR